ncbi:MAG: hypothetical protein QOD81_1257, partial [Solirubrobacteraceae bacterium]|nr:hypothetical protein [Solirubrobacteraceae bacterium]
MAGLLAGFVRRYAAMRVPGARTVVDLWPAADSPLAGLAGGADGPPDLVLG